LGTELASDVQEYLAKVGTERRIATLLILQICKASLWFIIVLAKVSMDISVGD
jgi:hypothetical protein